MFISNAVNSDLKEAMIDNNKMCPAENCLARVVAVAV